MPEQAREYVTKETPLMTVVRYLSPNYCPFEASSTNAAPNTQPLLPGPYLAAYQKVLDSFF